MTYALDRASSAEDGEQPFYFFGYHMVVSGRPLPGSVLFF
jgi:hypothetical protein